MSKQKNKSERKVTISDMQSIIVTELEKVDGDKKSTQDRIMVCCPFHSDNTPSCGIVVSEGSRYPLGTFNCLGCGANGDWNKFAQQLGLQQISDLIPKVGSADTHGLNKKLREMSGSLLTDKNDDMESMLDSLGNPSYIEWPKYNEWRGYPGWLIKNLNGLAAVNKRSEFKCILPVKVGKEIKGVIEALEEKQEGKLSYLSSPGDWVKESGLFPFNYVKKMLSYMKFKYVILVEGPRDALRLIMAGIPALAVLGSQNISGKKIKLLERLDVDLVCWLPDNDKAGREMGKKLTWFFTESNMQLNISQHRSFKLPRDKDDEGNLIKLDPDSMNKKLMKALKDELREYGAKFLKEDRLRLIVQ